jgi:type IV secretion system protein VirD4
VRIAFATNDERTAKRISEMLGTATELRAQRNYAGHRLAPWLGHLMVSRQETARPLLTPGEIMQLPPDDAVVMASGHPPIRAKKLRYYQDANFERRVFKPPTLVAAERYHDAPAPRADDWSGLSVPETPRAPSAHVGQYGGPVSDDGGLQRRPELVAEVSVGAEPEISAGDLAVLDDDDSAMPLPRELDPRLQRVARIATLDPADGIPL